TLIALDGQILNDGNTGDLDVSRFPVAAFRALDVTEGLGPRDSEGSNTIGGAVNLLSLRPTRDPHHAFSLSVGSFGRTEGWYNTTGTHGRFGYALALDNQQEHGWVDQDVLLCGDAACTNPPEPQHLGSSISSRSALANLTWAFSPNADLGVRAFTMGNHRDESGVLNTPADAAAQGPGDLFVGTGDALFSQNIRAYDVHSRAPLGAGSLALDFSVSNNTVGFSGGALSPYDGAHQDKRNTLSAQWGRTFDNSEFEFGGYTRSESLLADGVDGLQHQAIQSYFARGAVHPSERLRLNAALFASHYSTFGSNLDGRFGMSYDLDSTSALRFSAGTGFRAPLLIERYVFPAADLQPDANCVLQGQGNAGLNPEHATEYEVGYSKTFASRANLDVALYRTNLRDPIENYYPLGASCPGPAVPLMSFPINVANVIYQGAEVRFVQQFDHLYLRAQYGLNVAYPYNLPATVANPTSGGNLVGNAQFLNIPQQVGSLGLDWVNQTWHGALDATFRGNNNELNRPAFAVFNAGIGKRVSQGLDLSLAFTNLTNEAS
ncbi:MAG TPA: TonB-dependent receptor, partial [Candidatus Baltobacteraceae bacterium]|nr:TonB-dependent receptor [Candidatus Baltobacteraceae bacterium]